MAASFAHLVQVEIGGVQSYIFDGSRLREWRGASALLDKAERVEVQHAVTALESDVAVLRQGGGVIVLGVPEAADASTVENAVVQAYRDAAPGAQVYSAHVALPAEAGKEAIQSALSALTFKVERNRGMRLQVDLQADLLGPMARPCDSCGQRPAETDTEISDDGRLVCHVCSEKGQYGGTVRRGEAQKSVLDRFRTYVQQRAKEGIPSQVSPSDLTSCIPDDLGAIAETGSALALIQADGNSLGKTVQALTSLEQYESLAANIAQAVEEALFETLAQHGPENGTLPWEILFLGGDDILVATSDRIALDVATSLIRRVEERTQQVFQTPPLDDLGRSHLSLGAGIVVADPHVPIAVLRELAYGLERSAKKRTYRLQNEDEDAEVSTIDLHRITGSGSASIKHVRTHALKPRRSGTFKGIDLTQRPFTLRELADIIHVAQSWKEAGLPNNKLHVLRESLFTSPAEAMRTWTHTVGRASKSHHPAWMQLHRLISDAAGEKGYEQPPFAVLPPEDDEEDQNARTPLLDVLDVHALL